eukprot:UN27293
MDERAQICLNLKKYELDILVKKLIYIARRKDPVKLNYNLKLYSFK